MADINKAFPGWETVREIGRGSYGTVYEIKRVLGDYAERAAVKVISLPQDSSEIEEYLNEGASEESITKKLKDDLDTITSEYKMMSVLKGNTNIVNCDEVVQIQQDNGMGWDIYIKMELLSPITKALPSQVDEETVIKLGMDICKALELCEKKNIIHRDIKPHNIFVSEFGDYKLGDFGVAKVSDHTTKATKAGTYDYMSPEVYFGRAYNNQADIYSLGIVLYKLLNNNKLPFLGDITGIPTTSQKEEATQKRVKGEMLPEPKNGSQILKLIVLKACIANTDVRYSSAGEMLKDLKLFQESGENAFSAGYFDDVYDSDGGTIGRHPGGYPGDPPFPNPPKKPKIKYIVATLITLVIVIAAAVLIPYYLNGRDHNFVPVGSLQDGSNTSTTISSTTMTSTSSSLIQTTTKPEYETVLDYEGLDMSDARQQAQKQCFEVKFIEEYSNKPEGTVVSQSPREGETLKRYGIITLYVSKGSESIYIPDLEGLNVEEAERKIEEIGLGVNKKEYQNSDEPAGTVIGQNISNVRVQKDGTSIILYISNGSFDEEKLQSENRDDKKSSTDYKSFRAGTTVIISSETPAHKGLNGRSQPNSSSMLICVLSEGEKLTVVEDYSDSNNGYIKVSANTSYNHPIEFWVLAKYLEVY